MKKAWRITAVVIWAVITILIIYDIMIIVIAPEATESNVMRYFLWKLPIIAFTWSVLTAHFFSFVSVPYKKLFGLFILIPVVVGYIIFTIFYVKNQWLINPFIHFVIGTIAGTFGWSQRDKYNNQNFKNIIKQNFKWR